MATLVETGGSRRVVLEGASVVGRSPSATLNIAERYISSQHALIRWKADHWELRDRSHNGTYLNGARVAPDQPYRLTTGDKIAFGDPAQEWALTDDAAPRVMVVARTGEALMVEDGVLGLPLGDVPEVTVFRDADGVWKLEERTGTVIRLDAGSEFTVAGQIWRFCCPQLEVSTLTHDIPAHDPAPLLHFLVSKDEEYVELRLEF